MSLVIYSLRSIVIGAFFHFRPFHSNRVISLFSKSQHIFPHLLYSLLLFSIFISLPFSFFTLFSLYLTHLTQFFLISVPKSFASITMERSSTTPSVPHYLTQFTILVRPPLLDTLHFFHFWQWTSYSTNSFLLTFIIKLIL